ncbi:MAG: N-acetyltransferase family protein [Veillonella sp.]|nr:N-acetyltransferase family protein [Veillonella sp.]
MENINIRPGQEADIQALLDIYNYEVVNGVATLDLEPRTLEEWTEWYQAHNVDNHPLLVAEVDGQVAGYATLSAYRTKEAYRSTVELSVYIGADFRRRGVASALMKAILAEGRADERTHLIVSVITAGNEASEKLHEAFGFDLVGRLREVGVKKGAYRDTVTYALYV